MSNTIPKTIKELLTFYVKTHYENYLKTHELTRIDESQIQLVVQSIYLEKKEHSKHFVKDSLKKILKNEYPGDSQIDLLLRDLYEEDQLMIHKMTKYVKQHQSQST